MYSVVYNQSVVLKVGQLTNLSPQVEEGILEGFRR